jgi:hypothetical protein
VGQLAAEVTCVVSCVLQASAEGDIGATWPFRLLQGFQRKHIDSQQVFLGYAPLCGHANKECFSKGNKMKHMKMVTKKSQPSQAYAWDWFIDLKSTAAIGPGIIVTAGKPGWPAVDGVRPGYDGYIDELANSNGSIDPNAV